MTTDTPTMTMHEIGARIALALGGCWKLDTSEETNSAYCTLKWEGDDPHFGIGLYRNAREKRIYVHPRWPMATDGAEFPYSHDRPDLRISVGMNRDPAAIAREIERRFLPGYREAFARGIARRDEYNAHLMRQGDHMAMFADLLDGRTRGEMVDVPMGRCDTFGYIHGFQVGGNTVQWEFRSMPIDVARKVLEFWKSLQAS